MKALPRIKDPVPIEPDRDWDNPRNYVGIPSDRMFKQGPCQRCGCAIFGDVPKIVEYCAPCLNQMKLRRRDGAARTKKWSTEGG